MQYNNLLKGTLIKRYKRFLADVRLEDGSIVTAHCPNTGSMLNNNIPGSEVMLSIADNPKRKLPYTWEMVKIDGSWRSVNTILSNRIVAEAIEQGTIKELSSYNTIRREVKYGTNSRIDLLLENDAQKCYVEIKNVSLAEGKTAMFPDAVTLRGQKHLIELMKTVESGYKAVIFFVVQIKKATRFSPADHIDPHYGELLREAYANGVTVLAYKTSVTPREIKIENRIDVLL